MLNGEWGAGALDILARRARSAHAATSLLESAIRNSYKRGNAVSAVLKHVCLISAAVAAPYLYQGYPPKPAANGAPIGIAAGKGGATVTTACASTRPPWAFEFFLLPGKKLA